MRRTFALLLIIIASLPGTAIADEVKLKNGDRLTGKIVKADGKSLVLKSDFVGEVTIVWDAVASIASDETLYLNLADGRTVSGLVTTTGDQIEVRAAGAVSVSVPKSSVKSLRSEAEEAVFERQLHPGWFELWDGGADFGLALTSGNSKTTNVALGLALSRTTARDKTSVYAAAIYARDSTTGTSRTTANTVRGGIRYDRNFSKKWFGYGSADLEHNELQDLSLRLVLGGGLGYHAIQGERTQLDLLGGGDLDRENFSGNFNNRSSAELQFGQTLSYKVSSRASLKEQFFAFPNLTETGEYRLNFDTGLVTSVTRRIGWQVTMSDHYLSNPPPGFKKNDLLLTTGLSLKIGRALK